MTEFQKLKIESLEPSRSGRSLCYIDPEILDSLKLSTGDIIEIIGKRKTTGIAVTSIPDSGKKIIRIDEDLRFNLGSAIGEFITIRPTKAVPAREIEVAPIKEIYDLKKHADIIKAKMIDKPIITGDILRILGALSTLKSRVDHRSEYLRILDREVNTRKPTLGSFKLIVLNTKPHNKVVVFTQDTRIKVRKKIAFLKEDGTLISPNDIGGLKKEISEIRDLLDINFNHPSIKEKLNIESLKGILLVGPSGVGKTLLAKMIANETDYTFMTILPSDVMLKYQGESEQHLQELFQIAEDRAPSIIFIDHLDAIAPSIQIELLENARFLEHRIVTQLLALMDGIQTYENVIVLATTHKIELIEPALLRPGRFDKIIHIPLPNVNGRARIYHIHTRDITLSDDVSLIEIAKLSENFTGADIKGVCQLATINAIKREMPDFSTRSIASPEDLELSFKVEKQDFINAIEEIADRMK